MAFVGRQEPAGLSGHHGEVWKQFGFVWLCLYNSYRPWVITNKTGLSADSPWLHSFLCMRSWLPKLSMQDELDEHRAGAVPLVHCCLQIAGKCSFSSLY